MFVEYYINYTTYLCHFSSLHGATPIYYKYNILWQLLQIIRGKEVYKVPVHNLKAKEDQKMSSKSIDPEK